MSRTRIEELWTRFLSGKPLDADEERELLETLEREPELRAELLGDKEIDGLLDAAVGETPDEDAFVAAFGERLEDEREATRFIRKVEFRLADEDAPGTRRAPRPGRRSGKDSGGWKFGLVAAGLGVAILGAVAWVSSGAPKRPQERPRAEALKPGVDPRPGPVAHPADEARARAEAERKAAEAGLAEADRKLRNAEEARKQADAARVEDLQRKAAEAFQAAAAERKALEEKLREAREREARAKEQPDAAPPAPTEAAVAKIMKVEGEAQLVVKGEKRRVTAGQEIGAGQGVETEEANSLVEIVYPDESRLWMEAGTVVRELRTEGGKRVTIERGAVRADVRKQPAGRPMVFETSHAEVTVLGTTLRIVVDLDPKKGTTLEVQEGRVRFKRKLDGKVIEVMSGYFAVAAAGVELVARPLPHLLLAEDFQNPRIVATAWLGIVGGFPSTTREGRLEIDLTPQAGDPYVGGWHTPGGLRSRKSFPIPLRIELDLEMSASHNRITPTLVLKPPSTGVGPANAVYSGKNVVQVGRSGTGVWIVIGTGSGERKLQNVSLPYVPERSERWRVEIDRATISLSVDGREAIRPAPHGMDITEGYQIGLEASSKSDAPAGVKIRFDDLRVETLGEK